MSIIPLKVCNVCKQSLPATTEYWHVRKASKKDGLSNTCKNCANERRARNAKEHPEVRHAYYDRNRDRVNKQVRDYYHANPKRKEKVKAASRATYWKDVELSRQKSRDYGRAHSAEVVARNKKWAEEHPEAYRAYHARRSALERSAEGEYTLEDLLRIYDEQEGRCAYCGASIYWNVKRDIHVDHIHPLSRGGTNWPDNIALACMHCNSSKSDATVEEWMSWRGW